MGLTIKICGLRTPEALDVALHAGADMVGFVFFRPSPRHIDFAAARELGARVNGRALKVALFVDADDEWLAASIAALAPDLLQLHGRETPERVLAVKARFRLPVMKAIAVETRDDLRCIADYAEVADRLIFDARAPRDATRPGGLGKPFDWRLLKNLDPPVPFMLSGGLNRDNVAEAIEMTGQAGSMSRPASSARRAKRTPTSFAASFVRRGEQWTANVRQVSDELLAMNVQHPNSYRTGPDERGHFGIYGGRFVAETLMPLILDLERAYADAKADPHDTIGFMALLDSGATGLFIDRGFVHRNGLKTRALDQPIKVYNVDDTLNQGGSITEEITLMISHKGHKEKAVFEVCDLGKSAVILGHPWLWKHNPEINWQTGKVKMSRCP